MKDDTSRDNASHEAPSEHVLGKVQPGGYDTDLHRTPDDAPQANSPQPVKGLDRLLQRSESKGTSSLPTGATNTSQHEAQAQAQAQAHDESGEKLALPQDALVAMRKSGGFRFTSRKIIVYANGRIEIESKVLPGEATTPPSRKLHDKELAKLYRAIEAANLPGLPLTSGRQNPDGYAYEIAARVGQSIHNVEAFDGSIPKQLAPLVEVLTGYMEPNPATS